ncbi:MAG: hypothetical protein ACYS0H_26310, partial [Planctomycetota bacterium]
MIPDQIGPNPLSFAVNMGLQDTSNLEVMPSDDGGVVVDFDPHAQGIGPPTHNSNLADHMTDSELAEVASDLVNKYEADEESRQDWKQTYIDGIDLLGLKFEERTEPWQGACGVFHPLLAESVVRFQSQTIQEIFPASGPAKAKLAGKETPERVEQTHRVVNYLNHLATEEMAEYRDETERSLFCLPLAGSAFKKVYFDPDLGRPTSMFVPPEDFVVAYGSVELTTCERATHIMRRSANWIRKMQVAGFYSDIELGSPSPTTEKVREKFDSISGSSVSYKEDDRHTLLEMMVDYNMPGFESPDEIASPYVVTIDHDSRQILSIRRNWREGDPEETKRGHWSHYKYLPGMGFYGLGLIHIVGGLAHSATSILRQLVDSGTLANLPGGFKTKGLRVKGDDSPIAPGEYRDVDIAMGALKDNIMPLPYKEPSTVLYQLLGDIVEEGRRFASAADVKASEMNGEAPVGTTLAILEREMKVMSAVQARVHHSMGRELKLLAELVRDHGPEQYPYDLGDTFSVRQDFDERIDVIPVSDPNAGTMAQRIMQYQAALQLSQTAPQIYDIPYLHRQMLEVLNIDGADKIVPSEDDMRPSDPVSENMALLKGEPVKAFAYQDHEAHIVTHMAMAQNPQIQSLMADNPQAESIMAAGAAHIAEHVAFAYRRKIEEELGIELPDDESLPEDIELRLSRLVAPAAEQLTGKAQQQAQAEKNAEMQEDPVIQMQMEELGIKKGEQQRKLIETVIKGYMDYTKHQSREELEHRRL